MIPISLETLVASFGFNGAELIGSKIMPSALGRRKSNDRYKGLTIKSFSGVEFTTGNGWHETNEFHLGNFTFNQLEMIIKGLEGMVADYKGMKNHLSERGEDVYDIETIGIDKVIALAKKSEPAEAKKLFMEILHGTTL